MVAQKIGIDWLGGLSVCYRNRAGLIQVVSRPEFRKLVRAGEVDSDTAVIDLSVDTLAGLRGLERPASASWHGQVFGLKPSTMPV